MAAASTTTIERHKMNERTNVPNCQHQHSRCAALSLLSAVGAVATLFINCQAAPVSASLPLPHSHICALLPISICPAISLPSSSAHTKRFPFIRLAQAASIASSSSGVGVGSGGSTQKYLLYSYVFMFLMLLFLFLFALSMLLTLSAPLLLMLYTAQAERQ